jgi:hypothetical protein
MLLASSNSSDMETHLARTGRMKNSEFQLVEATDESGETGENVKTILNMNFKIRNTNM